MRIFSVLTASALLLGSVAPSASAAVLDFDIPMKSDQRPDGQENDQPVVAGYGDNLADTPDVTVDFAAANFYNYGGAAGGTIYPSGGQNSSLSITFRAVNGSAVQLNSFDVARYEDDSPSTISYFLKIGDLAEQEFFATPVPKLDGPQGQNPFLTVDLGGVQSAPNGTIVLRVPVVGPSNYDPIIDNVAFAQVPEPTSLGLLGLGAVGMLARRRRA
jgi:hypothetical protein